MMASDFIVDVTEADFEYEVLAYSQQMPVIVDFWAEWCGPCRTLGPLLEKLAYEARGGFRLAKVNVDENPNLALRYAVRSIPAVKAFRDGKMVAEFIGAQPESRVREFLRSIAPSPSDLNLEKGFELLKTGDLEAAEASFRQVFNQYPEHTTARLGLSKALLLQGRPREAHILLEQFPACREFDAVEKLRPYIEALLRLEASQDSLSEDPLEAAFQNSLRLAKRGNLEAAMDGLLDILRQDKRYRDGEARRIMLALLELLGEESLVARQYRSELASVLF